MNWNTRYAAERPAPINEDTERVIHGVIPTAQNLWYGMRAYEGQNPTFHRDMPTLHGDMRALYTGMVNGLLSVGVGTIDEHGVPFDPSVHNAIGTLCDNNKCPRSHYVEIMSPGFTMGKRVIRPADVRIIH